MSYVKMTITIRHEVVIDHGDGRLIDFANK